MITHVAQETLFNNVQKHLEQERRTEEITSYPVGAIVLAQYHDKGLGRRGPTKLSPRWEGPFRVVNISSDGNTYDLQNFLDSKITSRHITDLKLFFYDPAIVQMSLQDIAIRDRIHEFPVEEVLQHRLKENVDTQARTTRSSDIEFLIKWRGFGDKWNTWEPFKNVRLNEVVIEYLRNNKLKRFIPRVLETDPVVNNTVSFSIINHVATFIQDSIVKRDESLEKWEIAKQLAKQLNLKDTAVPIPKIPVYLQKEGKWKKMSKSWILIKESD